MWAGDRPALDIGVQMVSIKRNDRVDRDGA